MSAAGRSGLLEVLPLDIWLAIAGGTLGLLLLLAAYCSLRSSRRRKLLFLMCTHPNPAMGPLYLPDELRDEYAAEIGLKRPPPQCSLRVLQLKLCLGLAAEQRAPPPTADLLV